MLVDVAVPVPGLPALTYRVPESFSVELGSRVLVPLGRRTSLGVVVKVQALSQLKTLKDVLEVHPAELALPADLLELGKWMAEYYQCTWGEALGAMWPPLAVSTRRSKSKINEAAEETLRDTPLVLMQQQKDALAEVKGALQNRAYAGMLLHGVTGSGKTEVYLQAIECALEQKRGAILLVPEIALTPQTCRRVTARFGSQVVLWHSQLAAGERAKAWQRLKSGDANIALGARSAVFAPVRNLGLVVVDEESEPSYKQEDVPRYHARDVAAIRARAAQAVLLLGSATPSVESYYNALQGRYRLLGLPARVDHKALPEVRLVDMAEVWRLDGRLPLFSQELLDEMDKCLRRQEQCILFLNRRGFAPVVMCPSCRHVITCPDCSTAMVYHRQGGEKLVCHTCDKRMNPNPACPKCGAACVRLAGAGTQRVEEELQKHFPTARLLRLDVDATRARGSLAKTLDAFGNHEADVLIGTQMVAKGMDFPNVTLVGIVSADTALHLPDFRAQERTFQLLVQVAGRSGRGGKPGLVLVQTLNAAHPVMDLARRQDYPGFYEQEIGLRRDLQYPPFARLATVVCRGTQLERTLKTAQTLAQRMRRAADTQSEVLGPAPAPRARVAREERFLILLKSPTVAKRALILRALQGFKLPSGVKMSVDIDPQDLL
jgi:primosomal protein N' (replication factor Y)